MQVERKEDLGEESKVIPLLGRKLRAQQLDHTTILPAQ
jgi:hypothetical protein